MCVARLFFDCDIVPQRNSHCHRVREVHEILAVSYTHLDVYKRQLFTFEVARCIGACGLAPAMSIDDQVYKQVNPDKLEQILKRYYEED